MKIKVNNESITNPNKLAGMYADHMLNKVEKLKEELHASTVLAEKAFKKLGKRTENDFKIKETIIKEVQKKSNALIESLQKENKLTKPLKLEISCIDNIEDLNETIKIHKTKNSSALQKAIESGAETALEQGWKSTALLLFDYHNLNFWPLRS